MNSLLAVLSISLAHSASTISAVDLRGNRFQLPIVGKPTVLFFITTECPIANRLMPELRRIVRDFRKASFFFVYADPATTRKAALAHSKSFEINAPALLDPKHELVHFAKASVTPETVLYGRNGKLEYQGRINDSYSEHNRPRNKPLKNDLRDALSQILSSKPVQVPFVQPVGCPIPD